MSFRRHHHTPTETPPIVENKEVVQQEIVVEQPPIVEEKKVEPPIIEEQKPVEKPVNTSITKKKAVKTKAEKNIVRTKVLQDELRGLELNAKSGNIDSNVHTARHFKSIVKMKGLKINKVLHTILTRWIKENS